MFKTSKMFNKIKDLTAGGASDKSESKKTDLQIARINALLDAAERANKSALQKKTDSSFETLNEEFSSLKKEVQNKGVRFDSHENTGGLERKIEEHTGIQKRLSEEISILKNDVELLKKSGELSKEIARDSKTMPDDARLHESEQKIFELAKKVSDLSREMNLDSIMYPKDIMDIKKEVADLKSAQKKFAGAAESLAKMKKGFAEHPEYGDKLKKIEINAETISKKISETASLSAKITAMNCKISSIDNEINVLKISKSSDNSLQGMEKIDTLSKKVAEIGKEMNLDRAMYPADIMKLEKEVENLKNEQASIKKAKELPDKSKNIDKVVLGLQKEINALRESLQKNAGSFELLSSRIGALESGKNIAVPKSNIDHLLAANAELEKKYIALESEMPKIKKHAIDLEASIEDIKSDSVKRETITPRAYIPESRIELPAGIAGTDNNTEKMLKRLEEIRKSLNT